jgi:hypothetical protein
MFIWRAYVRSLCSDSYDRIEESTFVSKFILTDRLTGGLELHELTYPLPDILIFRDT